MQDTFRTIALFVAAVLLALHSSVWARALDESTRSELTEAAAEAIETKFFDSELGKTIAEALREHAADGGFAEADTSDRYTQALSDFLREYDAHFSTVWRDPDTETASRPSRRYDGPADNYGFKRTEVLPGNVGYIRLDGFYPAHEAGDAALAALEFVAHADAVIFDLRYNGGGAPSMVQFLISHFLAVGEERVINTFVSSARDYPDELKQLDWVPGPRRPNVPLYVLTSARTGSAGEAFPYHLQAMERATVVGERTGGAGNPGGYFDLGHGYRLFVSTGSARNPITGTNWEGEGVVPDVAVESEQALDAALDHAYAALLEAEAISPARRENVRYAREALAMGEPLRDGTAYADLAGDYGPYTITADESGLMLRRGRRPANALIPAGDARFFVEDLPYLRVQVERGDRGAVVAIALERAGARPARFDRIE